MCGFALRVETGNYKGFPECLGYVCRVRGLWHREWARC